MSGDQAAAFEVVGLSEAELAAFDKLSAAQRPAVLQVFVESELDDPPALAGSLETASGRLRFVPRYPLEPGVRYRVSFAGARLAPQGAAPVETMSAVFPIEKQESAPTTVVEHIYPSATTLPENQLKFYIHFSAPMSRGEAYQHVHLIDAETGAEVEGAFLELGEELWDDEFRRFTLLCDPGRVKRGLKPREELGPVLVEGRRYTLVVDNAWRDATRTALNAGARKNFSVAAPDDATVDPKSWQVEPPAADSVDPLLVRFGEPLDHSMLLRVLSVVNAAGEKVPGTIATGDDEGCWQFTPERPWVAGSYQLVAAATLEDLAGNSIGRPFEVDEFAPVQKRIETSSVSVAFDVK